MEADVRLHNNTGKGYSLALLHLSLLLSFIREAILLSKWDVNNENCHILTCVYLVKHKVILFLLISVVHHGNMEKC